MIVAPAGDFADWDGLLALILSSFAFMDGRIDPPSSAHRLTAQALADRARAEHLFLAWDRDRLMGCVFCAVQDGALYIGKLAVATGAQGRGIGRALMARAEGLARDLALPRLRLETRVELVENHATFARLGFAKVAEKSHAGFDRVTSITMEKPLW